MSKRNLSWIFSYICDFTRQGQFINRISLGVLVHQNCITTRDGAASAGLTAVKRKGIGSLRLYYDDVLKNTCSETEIDKSK